MNGRSQEVANLRPQQDGGRANARVEMLAQALRVTFMTLVRHHGPELTMRQLSVLLTVCLVDGPHTVRGLAAELNVSKVAITRALDRLTTLGLVRRQDDPRDRRSVLAVPTTGGMAFLAALRRTMAEVAGSAAVKDQRAAA